MQVYSDPGSSLRTILHIHPDPRDDHRVRTISYEAVSSPAARFVEADDSDVTEDTVDIPSIYPAALYSLR